jgi:hypothetical protein
MNDAERKSICEMRVLTLLVALAELTRISVAGMPNSITKHRPAATREMIERRHAMDEQERRFTCHEAEMTPPFDNRVLRRVMQLSLDHKSSIDILGEGQYDIGAVLQLPAERIWGMPQRRRDRAARLARD